MKKATVKKKYPEIEKNKTFQSLWSYYDQARNDFLNMVKQEEETRKTYRSLKEDKSASGKERKTWKERLRQAKKQRKEYDGLVDSARKQIKNWLRLYERQQQFLEAAPKKTKKKVEKNKKKEPAIKKTVRASSGKKAKAPKVAKEETPKAKVRADQRPVAAKVLPAAGPEMKMESTRPSNKAAIPSRVKTPPKPDQKDDFKRIAGIGNKIEKLLQNAGIRTFRALSEADNAKLRSILDEAGARYRHVNPDSWSQQAEFAVAGKWEELKNWQEKR